MSKPSTIQGDPAELHLPPSRLGEADPAKLARQISRFGTSIQGIPPVLLYRGADDAYMQHVRRALPSSCQAR